MQKIVTVTVKREIGRRKMTEDQIKHMVDRFLGWRLPENFNPDGGISFKRTFNDHLPTPTKYEPTGTNLLDATQATSMVRHMVEGMRTPAQCSPSRDVIARIINGVAFRPAYISGEGLSETQKEKYLRARSVAYYQADCILAEMDKASAIPSTDRGGK
jgi:hypothetical protein